MGEFTEDELSEMLAQGHRAVGGAFAAPSASTIEDDLLVSAELTCVTKRYHGVHFDHRCDQPCSVGSFPLGGGGVATVSLCPSLLCVESSSRKG